MIKLDGRGLVPAIVQDANTGQALMLGYMSPGSIKRTLEEGPGLVLQPQQGRPVAKGRDLRQFP